MIKKRVKNFTAMVLMISMIVTNSLTQLLYAAGEDPIQTLQVRDTNQTTTPSVLDLNVSDEWDQFEGDWNITTDGVYTVGSNVNGKSGSKVVAKDKDYSNFTYEADVKLTSGINEDNAGLLFRVTDPTNGADNLKGYYAGIRVDGKVQIGRFNNEWAEIGLGDYPIKTHMTYRLKVVADGNKIDVYVDGNYAASATDDMFSHGSIGMRNWWAATTYSNVSVVDTVEGTDTTEVDKWTFYPVTDTVTENDWMISEHSYKAKSAMGTKIVAKDSDYANFSLQADVSLVGKDGGRNAGFIFRTSDPGVGTDNLKGYYAGIGNGKVQIGKLDNTPGGTAWTELKGVNYPIVDGVTYHLKVVAKDEKVPVDVSTYEWAQYQGNWAIADGIFNVNAGTGYKVVARDVNISNFAYEADVSISGGTDTGRNAGFIFRVTEPTVGADMLKGYYAGITKNGRVQVGRFNNNWTELAAIPYPIVEGTEYKLKVIASGSNINVYVDGTHVISVTDDMFKSGSIGMRTWLTNATYKNVALTDLGEVIEAEYDWSWVKGAVFVPTNVVNEIQQWKEYDHDINDRELSYAHDYGFNLVRVYLHNLLWEYEKEELLGNFEDFLQLADKYDIKVEVVFFDDCWDDFPKYDYDESIAPRYGAHNSRWVEAPGDTYKAQYNNADGLMKAKMKEYVEGIVGSHLNDDRVAFWNTYNEPSNGESGINDQVTKQLMNDSRIWIKEMGSEIPVSATGGQFSGGPFSDFITWHPYEANYPTNIGGTRPATANKSTLADECMQRQNQTVPGIVQNYYDKGIGFVLWELGIGRDNCRFPWGSDTNPLDYEPAEPFHGVVYPDGHPWSVDDVVAVRGNLDNLAVFNVQYFNDTQFTDLKKTSITPRIDFDLGDERGTGSPDASAQIGEDNFSVRWTGTIKSAAAGNYTIYADSDNIAKVWIGDTQVINKSTNVREAVSETISLEANKEYSIKVEYVHATGNASMHLKWAVPSGTKTVLLPIYKTKSVTGVSLPETLSVNVEEGKKLIATLEPADTLNQQVTWESSEPGIACVDKDGVVTGIVEGTATITVTTVDGDFKDTCTVTVSPSTEFKNPIVPVSSSAGSADPSVVFKDG
ncbi:MAG: hypothetical protein K0S61_4044, partial [Anaerocolumna sp.]|nr:hypothetical protein [Anaerocolumna sp.]